MGLDFLLGQREFRSAKQIIEMIEDDVRFGHSGESFEERNAVPIFKTSKQQTWLVASNRRLYCVLDDPGKGFTRLQWTKSREELFNGKSSIDVPIITRGHSDAYLLLDIGDRTGWLLSRRLFDDSPAERVKALIMRSME